MNLYEEKTVVAKTLFGLEKVLAEELSENGFYVGNGSENLKSNIDYLYYLYKNF